jgi:hypothetical protein
MSYGWTEPDPDFWKGPYAKIWKKHVDNVKALKKELESRFPDIDKRIKYGLGALTDELLKIPPDERGEPDFTIYKESHGKYEPFCSIEVSGSDRVRMPNVIWIRPDKLESAMKKKQTTWFYMVYPNEIRLVSRETLKKHEKDVHTHYLKKNPETGEPIPEDYIHIPYKESYPADYLLGWIDGELSVK